MKFKSLKKTINIKLLIMVLCVGVFLISVSFFAFLGTYNKFYKEKATDITLMAANMVDGDKIQNYEETLAKDDYYNSLQEQYNKLKENLSDVNYLYICVPHDDHFTYILEARTSDDDLNDIANLGDEYYYDETDYKYFAKDVVAQKASTRFLHYDNKIIPKSISAWRPIYNSNNELVAMIETDYKFSLILNEVYSYVAMVSLVLITSIIIIGLLVSLIIKRSVTKPINKLISYINSYESGNFAGDKLYFQKQDEIKYLSDSFYSMIEKNNEHIENIKSITKEKARIKADLTVATNIQASMLPCIFPAFPERKEFEIYATMTPAKEVGGDFYDFYMIDSNHMGIVMADVSGKGVPAALFMAISKAVLQSNALLDMPPKEVIETTNKILCANNSESMFVTVWFGILEISSGKITAVNAGHEYPVIMKAGGNFEYLKDKHGMMVAAMDCAAYKEYEIQLEPGDKLFLYTDGIPEATNAENEMYGMERELEILNRCKNDLPEDMLKHIREDVDTFVNGAPQFDDLTMLILNYNGAENDISSE